VRAVLDRFPGAEIVAVRDVVAEDIAAPMPDSEE
jgi:DNA polymerase-3 subunit gamma/tau